MFYGDEAYKESMKQMLFQIIVYDFNVFEVSLTKFSQLHWLINFLIFLAHAAQQILRHIRPAGVVLRAQHKNHQENSFGTHAGEHGLCQVDGIR